MKLKETLERSTQFLTKNNSKTPRLDAELLLSNALDISRVDLYLKFEKPLSEKELEVCREFVKRRAQGEPVAYITKEKGFYKYDFYVDERVLIPRPESELLVEQALAWASKNNKDSFNIIDLGCGSGCLGLSLLNELENSKLLAVDLSEEAVEVTKLNAEKHNVLDRAHFLHEDAKKLKASQLPESFEGHVDIIIANPPYIAKDDTDIEEGVLEFEPHIALFSEEKGLQDISVWLDTTVDLLKGKGFYCFEFGYSSGGDVSDILKSKKEVTRFEILQDYAGFDRLATCYLGES